MPELSIVIPASNPNGIFINYTIKSILENMEADTEIIVVYNGAWPEPGIPQHELVNVVHYGDKIGQRAAINVGVKLSKAKYIMKCDAHCSFDKGFDRKMLEAFKVTGDNVTMTPIMRNLWAFDWKCYYCGWKKYQGPTPEKCEQCGKTDKLRRKMMWVGKNNPQSTSYCFDSSPHFQYFEDWKHRPQYRTDKKEKGLTETMSLQGSCWMLTREKYWELEVCDEAFGSWGSQGIEVASKTWLSGGQVLVNHNTWYAHMFRTQGGDFGFSHPITAKEQEKAKRLAKDLFFNNKWDKQIRPLSWLVEKFWPVKGWTDQDLAALKANKFEFKESNLAVETEEVEPAEEAKPSESVPETGTIYFTNTPEARVTLSKKVTIIGFGWVGKSVKSLFSDAYIYDLPNGSKEKANEGDVAFICVPTPSIEDGKLDISIVEECVSWCQCPLIVIRSTINPGTGDYLSKKYNKRIIVQPEYMGETAQHPFVIIGGNPEDRRALIDLYATVYNANIKIRQVTAYEAEVIKLTENRAISFKVAQCQELYAVCEKAGMDYYTIRDVVYGDDPRFNLWWTFVDPNSPGFNSESLPKDVYAWCAWAESLGVNPEITRNLLDANKKWLSQGSKDLKTNSLMTDQEIPAEEESSEIKSNNPLYEQGN